MVVGKVPVSVDDLADGRAGGGLVDEVLAGGEGGDQGLQGQVVDCPGVAAAGGVDADEQAAALLARDPAAHAALDNPDGVAILLHGLRLDGTYEQAAALADRAAAHAPLDHLYGVNRLLDRLWEMGALKQVAALAERAAAHTPLDNPDSVADLLASLERAGALQHAVALAERAAAHTPLDNPDSVADMLDIMRRAGARDQAAALLARDPAAHTTLDNPRAVAKLLDSLRRAGAHEQADTLTDRLPAAGMSGFFLKQKGLADQFRFGRKADGTPAAPWDWEDLDLWLVRHRPGRAWGRYGHRHRNRRDDLNNRFPNRSGRLFETQLAESGWRRDQPNGTRFVGPLSCPAEGCECQA